MHPSNFAEPTANLRAALQALVHELYFKSSHFPGLKGHSPRELHDLDHERYATCPIAELRGMADPFTSLLTARAARIPGSVPTELVATWERAESTLNARMRVVLGFLGTEVPQVLSESIAGAGKQLPPLRVTAGRNPIGGKRNDKLFGQPDIVLLGETVAVTVEMKVRGGKALAKYDAEQHFKYLRLAQAMNETFGVGRVYHVLLAPLAGGRVVKGSDRWLAGTVEHGAPLVLDRAGFIASISAKQRDQALAAGGEGWIATLEDRMPSRAIDLTEFLDAVDRLDWADDVVRFECGRQVAALRAYGLRGVPTRAPPNRRPI